MPKNRRRSDFASLLSPVSLLFFEPRIDRYQWLNHDLFLPRARVRDRAFETKGGFAKRKADLVAETVEDGPASACNAHG